jgi:hypothetical protein
MTNSGNSVELSLSKAYIPRTTITTNVGGSGENPLKNQNGVPSTAFFSLWPTANGAVNADHQQNQNHWKSQKFTKSHKHVKRDLMKRQKKTMDISKGLRFSAPAPMTLNRYRPQMNQEKTAPESKDYLEMRAQKEIRVQKQIEEKHMAEARVVVEERLKQVFELGQHEVGFGFDFDNENKNFIGNTATKNKSLMKKILGKVRPKSTKQWQENQEKSSAIQAAMAAAAAAVEAATGNPSGLGGGGNEPLREENTRAIVNQAMAVSRQKVKTNFMTTLHPSIMATQEIDDFGRPIQFPVNEVMMKPKEDSVSDLDASFRNARKLPVEEIHMNKSRQYHDDESVSTLGTPRVFEQLDKLLLSEPHRFHQRPDLIHDFFEDNMRGSAAPPRMMTPLHARALIDQLDSGTLVGDMTAGTARAENAVRFCNIASHCLHPEHKYLFSEGYARDHRVEDSTSTNGEGSFDDSETSAQEKTPNDEIWPSPNPAFTQAIDNAIRKAEIRMSTKHVLHNKQAKEDAGGKSGEDQFSDHQIELLSDAKSGRNLVVDPIRSENKKNVFERKKPGKTLTEFRARNEGLLTDQGKFLLEKDDEYWDTLSTIASTANDRSSEYMDEVIQPGPIPGEITTSSSEMKSVTAPIETQNFGSVIGNSGKGVLEPYKSLEQGFSPHSEENLNSMMNDVTDLIDSDLLDKLPLSKNGRSINPIDSNPKNDLDILDNIEKSSKPHRKTTRMMSNQLRPRPETIDSSRLKESGSGSLAIAAASQIAKGIRSVSWGFEEIYEDKNSHLDFSDQDTEKSEDFNSLTRKAQPCPEGMHRNPHSADVQTGEEEDLLSRTFELSKGLLETIIGGQLNHEKNKKEGRQYASSNDARHMQFDSNEHVNLRECRDDLHEEPIDLSNTSGIDLSPNIHSRLESLRNQRTLALSNFRQSQIQMPAGRSEIESAERDRDRLNNISLPRDDGKPSSKEKDSVKYSSYQKAIMKHSHSEDSGIELKYTTSDSNASTTPSQKARDLRMQLDEAMRVSREIQISQNQLGNELNSFKKKYYKNPEIENYKTKTVRGL